MARTLATCLFLRKNMLNFLSYCLQRWFFSPMFSLRGREGPVRVLSCFFKSQFCWNALSHLEHVNGFSPVCILSCTFNLAGTGKWLLSSVGTFMHLQIATLVKSFFTFGTGKWQLCQNTLSSGNITHAGEKTYPYKQCEATCFFFRKDMPNFWSHCLQ